MLQKIVLEFAEAETLSFRTFSPPKKRMPIGSHKMHIFTTNISTFLQDIEDRCLLLMNSTSSVDLPFQEHRMMKKHHMDQNPYISSLCPKPWVVSDNMTWGDDVAKSLGPTD
jgi:hypothetical protein